MSARVATTRSVGTADSPGIATVQLRLVAVGALLVAGGVHVAIGFEHAGSNFGVLALVAGLSQGALAVALIARPSRRLLAAVVVLELMLIQLYLLNVTIGLPPVIAHSHVGGTRQVFGLTLAWPGLVDAQGLIAKGAESLAVVAALALRRES